MNEAMTAKQSIEDNIRDKALAYIINFLLILCFVPVFLVDSFNFLADKLQLEGGYDNKQVLAICIMLAVYYAAIYSYWSILTMLSTGVIDHYSELGFTMSTSELAWSLLTIGNNPLRGMIAILRMLVSLMAFFLAIEIASTLLSISIFIQQEL